ncbi:MAG: UDP-N-acetylglucosamine 2-epimerase (non-hydrolyzing) [Candidatus Heimdallarchaeota archaeon]|nr:MAG: UDP-N-acetylglucosamine 2-epimerase (non-hydrolyzing) [Candidatus Aminicenantes bacterium]UCG04727.1 MAG: UDP-N-acetylglucosamine 2-epimerase (non-hydrolyzing) [Candidatus Heimdallarchaeota archaeon]
MFSPILRALHCSKIKYFIIHTGQHYSYNMDKKFFEDLNLPEPEYKLENVKDFYLHGEQTAGMLKGIEKILVKEKPKITLVGGDANTNLAGALAARKLHIRVGHVEAGERSGDWRMPEEHNRIIIDHISEYLFATNKKAKENLILDNIKGKIFITGNPIVDAAYQNLKIARSKSQVLEKMKLKSDEYILMTLHREENVDNVENLRCVFKGLSLICKDIRKKIIFLAHPRTVKRINEFGLNNILRPIHCLQIEEPVGYLDFLNLLVHSSLVMTDSGGVQQESCILKIPCVTLRDNTEWIETLEISANILVGVSPKKILEGTTIMLRSGRMWDNPFGDGFSAKKIVNIIENDITMKGDKT